MRIIGGRLKGAKLYIPRNKNTRPLKDLVRESIFNLLIHSNKILFQFKQSNILDLYAGTGSFGLECISRQANNVYFIENEKDVLKILEKNIEKLNLGKNTKILSNDVISLIKKKIFLNSNLILFFVIRPLKIKM